MAAAVCAHPATLPSDIRGPKRDLAISAMQDALQASYKEQLVRALGKTLSDTRWNVNAYSGSAGRPAGTAASHYDSSAPATTLPEGLMSIEEDEEPETEQRIQDTAIASNMSFLTAGERKMQQKQVGQEGTRRGSLAGPSPPPPEFFCPISHCLMMEPVKILNTGVTINRTSAQAWIRTRSQVCPVTGQPLRGWVAMEGNEALRERWVAEQGISISLLENAAVMMHDLCAQVAR